MKMRRRKREWRKMRWKRRWRSKKRNGGKK